MEGFLKVPLMDLFVYNLFMNDPIFFITSFLSNYADYANYFVR